MDKYRILEYCENHLIFIQMLKHRSLKNYYNYKYLFKMVDYSYNDVKLSTTGFKVKVGIHIYSEAIFQRSAHFINYMIQLDEIMVII